MQGADLLGSYSKTPTSHRKWCAVCGVHVHYQGTVLRVHDGLPKLKDVPKEMGGSGVVRAE